ncbi:larval serum protein 1 beta chain-like [Homalodisca vitripennis]|uniref:larval serum protein 1 beta chain-like n=1 Tax=Homalodisca vitripennis TaxID=197043 RepID=UPI001EEACFA3|nr:larval serum protein 1 beta chain-like [Homalodisca vitripennis]
MRVKVSYYNEDVYLNQRVRPMRADQENPAWFNNQKYHLGEATNAPAAIEVDEAANRDPVPFTNASPVSSTTSSTRYFTSTTLRIDLYNVINYGQGEQPQNYQYVARQPQLNHKRFNIEAKVDSDKEAEAIVRVFIGPKYNLQGQQISLEYARQYFVEIDRFITKLKSGQNNLRYQLYAV